MSNDVRLPTGQTVDPEKLYTLQELADFYQATKRQAQRWITEGRIAFVRLPGGRGTRVPGTAIIAAFNAGYFEKDAPDRVARRKPQRRARKAAALAAAANAEGGPSRARSRRSRPPSGQIVA